MQVYSFKQTVKAGFIKELYLALSLMIDWWLRLSQKEKKKNRTNRHIQYSAALAIKAQQRRIAYIAR